MKMSFGSTEIKTCNSERKARRRTSAHTAIGFDGLKSEAITVICVHKIGFESLFVKANSSMK